MWRKIFTNEWIKPLRNNRSISCPFHTRDTEPPQSGCVEIWQSRPCGKTLNIFLKIKNKSNIAAVLAMASADECWSHCISVLIIIIIFFLIWKQEGKCKPACARHFISWRVRARFLHTSLNMIFHRSPPPTHTLIWLSCKQFLSKACWLRASRLMGF